MGKPAQADPPPPRAADDKLCRKVRQHVDEARDKTVVVRLWRVLSGDDPRREPRFVCLESEGCWPEQGSSPSRSARVAEMGADFHPCESCLTGLVKTNSLRTYPKIKIVLKYTYLEEL